jgi:hypothetical protein
VVRELAQPQAQAPLMVVVPLLPLVVAPAVVVVPLLPPVVQVKPVIS